MVARRKWSRAYARQASFDWKTFLRLRERSDVPRCHELLFLQMATEKIAKAYRFRDTNTAEEQLLTRHVGFQKFWSQYLLSPRVLSEFKDKRAHLETFRRHCRQLAGEVEKLAPAVDRTNRPQNAEYPWEDGDTALAPVDYTFPNLSLLAQPGGRSFLRWLAIAIDEFDVALPV